MSRSLYRVVLTGEIARGFSREAVIAALSRLLQTPAGNLVRIFEAGEHPIDDLLDADQALAWQRRLEEVGARVRVDRVPEAQARDPAQMHLHLPSTDDPAGAGMMTCPACGHRQLVASSCDECGVVFADYNRRPAAATARAVQGGAAAVSRRPSSPSRRRRQGARDIHDAANAQWRNDWLDEDSSVPTERYHINLFMGVGALHLAEPCERMILGSRTRPMLSWAGGAVLSPFLWTMYRKMWAWGLVIFVTEILLPVVLITLGSQQGVSPKVAYLGIALLVANRIFWPLILKWLYCRHARRTIMYLNRMAPTFAPDIDIATAGGTSRTSAFVGLVMALVVSLLSWNIVDTLHAMWLRAAPVYTAPPELPAPGAPTPAAPVTAPQDDLLVNENKWVATRNRLRTLGQRLNVWFNDRGRSLDPAALDIAQIAVALSLDAAMTKDGWDRDIRYESDGKGYRLVSAGPDGQFGNTDDVEYRRILER